jgi:hypothetical protein
MLLGKKYTVPAGFVLLRRVTFALMVLAEALLGQLAAGGPAQAGGEGYLGWASHGAYYGSSEAACRREWEYYELNLGPSRFIGSKPYQGRVDQAQCLWTTYQSLCTLENGGTVSCPTNLPNSVDLKCDVGYSSTSEHVCQKDPPYVFDPCTPQGGPAEGTRGNSDPVRSNPIQLSSGAKLERVTDFSTADGRLSVNRAYNNLPQRWTNITIGTEPMGQTSGWGFGFSVELHLSGALNATLFLPEGMAFFYSRTGSVFAPEEHGENYDYTVEFVGTPPASWSTLLTAPSQWKVTQVRTGRVFLLQTPAANINGAADYTLARVIRITDPDGYVQNFAYGTSGAIATVTDSYGRSLGFTWRPYTVTALTNVAGYLPVPDVLEQITLPDGNKQAAPSALCPSRARLPRTW